MAITIVQGSPQTVWVPCKENITLYNGGIVCSGQGALDEGVIMLGDASGVADVTNQRVPFGVILGSNRVVKVWDYTELCEKIVVPVAADPHDGSINEHYGVEGPYSKGDPVTMLKVAVITPSTVLRAPLKATDAATAPALLTATNISTDGLGITTNNDDFTNVASYGTIYCRTGANAGAYRVLKTTSKSIHTWDKAMIADIAIGDTFVAVPMRPYGFSTINFDVTSVGWIDCDDSPASAGTNKWVIIVLRLDLREAGKEYVEFMFGADHFGAYTTRA